MVNGNILIFVLNFIPYEYLSLFMMNQKDITNVKCFWELIEAFMF